MEAVLAHVAQRRPDGILFVGDLGSHDLSYVRRRTSARDARYLASVEQVLQRARAVCERVLYVPGNHDLPGLEFPGNVDGRVEEIGGVRIGGIGGAGPGRYGFAYEWDEDEIRARPALACDLLLCHAPPARTDLDRLHDGRTHVGSEAIRERATAHAGVLACGHIHESAGAVRVGNCMCVNVGALGEPFGAIQVVYLRWSTGLRTKIAIEHALLGSDTRSEWAYTW
ncbi:MAG: metallophosphoesterase family protein [Planctomycetes bacterium]|nr:metallophosphoesterase family protein [Planctomycetota bacterium]